MSRVLTFLLALGLALSLAGCGDDSKPAPGSSKGSSSPGTEQTPEEPVYWPLTGTRAVHGLPDHPVLIVKMDNTHSSRPQLGLPKADMVVEELVEGGMTRLAVFFHRRLPKTTGPVRSMRATDIALVRPVDGVVATSGAAAPTYKRLRKSEVVFRENKDKKPVASRKLGFFRQPGRVQPYDLMLNAPKLVRQLPKPHGVGQPYFRFGESRLLRKGKRARSFSAGFSPSQTTLWRYRKGRYLNTNSNAGGPGFRPDTVLVLRVREGDAGYVDPAGNRVPETLMTRQGGDLLMFHGGRVLRGHWSKEGAEKSLRLTAHGHPLPVPTGRTWLELVPRDQAGGRVSID